MLASVAEQASLSLTCSETPEDRFSHDKAQIFSAASFQGADETDCLTRTKLNNCISMSVRI